METKKLKRVDMLQTQLYESENNFYGEYKQNQIYCYL